MICLDNEHLMMIEPTQQPVLVQDVWTRRARGLMFRLKEGTGWRGVHDCVCGASSQCFELITPQGRITNSLLAHYVECHRAEVPHDELVKLYAEFMNWALIETLGHMERSKCEKLRRDTARVVNK